MNHFVCRYCKLDKELTSSNFKPERRTFLGFDTVCRPCRRIERNTFRSNNKEKFLLKESQYRNSEQYKKYHSQYWDNNRDELSNDARKRYHKNPTPYLQRSKEQREKNPYAYKAYLKKWRTENRKYLNEKMKYKLKTNPQFKLRHTLRTSLGKAIRLQGGHKSGSILKYIGCSIEFLKGYLESKFNNGMTWENHGKVWHIDHILPCVSFNLLTESEIFKCYHYSNLQPLLIIDNLLKGDTLPDGISDRKILTSPPNIVSS